MTKRSRRQDWETDSYEYDPEESLRLEFHRHADEVRNPDSLPARLYCDRNVFDVYNDDCYVFGHEWTNVRYPLWDTPAGLVACDIRVTVWNSVGRYRESLPWIRTYVMLLVAFPHLGSLRGVFRKYALTLRWPAYEILED
jgi:hypothetical protein